MTRLIKWAEKNPKYIKAAEKDFLHIVNGLVSFMEMYDERYKRLYEKTKNPILVEEEVLSDLKNELKERERSVFSDYIYAGDLATLIYKEMEDKGKNPEDDSEFFPYVSEVLYPWDDLESFIAENGQSDEANKIIHDKVKEFLSEY